MKKLLTIFLFLLPSIIWGQTNYFVSPSGGSDSNPGTISQPFATWQKAINTATTPGDTIFIRGGIYYSVEPIDIDPDHWQGAKGGIGTYANPIVIMSYPGEWGVLDCSAHCGNVPPDLGYDFYNNAISIQNTEYYVFKDFEIQNVYQCDSIVDGAIASAYSCNLTFDHIVIHDVGQRGYWVQGGVWGPQDGYDPDTPIAPSKWGFGHPDTTRWINCDTYNLCDTMVSNPGNAADGWKTVAYKGNYFYWEGCRAWNYTDDGFDASGGGSVRIFRNCWAAPGDKYRDFDGGDIEGNGFKATGPPERYYTTDTAFLEITNCIAYNCVGSGIAELDGQGYVRNNALIYNNTVYKCGIGIFGWRDDAPTVLPRTSIYRNNIAFGATQSSGAGVYEVALYYGTYTHSHNTWIWNDSWDHWVYNPAYTMTDADFNDTTHINILTELMAPRNADNSLPTITTLALAPTSDLIDGGVDVGISYAGLAPDLGAEEFIPVALAASFTAVPNPTLINTSISFDAFSSTSDTTITTYSWNFGDDSVGSGVTISHSYSSVGNYTAWLTVTDANLDVDSTSITIVINDPPNASFTAVPNPAVVDETITFNGTASSDTDGTISSYYWDFNNGYNASGSLVNYAFPASGVYDVSLTVTDNLGATDDTTVVVSVTAAIIPSDSIIVTTVSQLQDSVNLGSPGDIIYIMSNSMTGNVTLTGNGESGNNMIITRHPDYHPYLDTVYVNGDYLTIRDVKPRQIELNGDNCLLRRISTLRSTDNGDIRISGSTNEVNNSVAGSIRLLQNGDFTGVGVTNSLVSSEDTTIDVSLSSRDLRMRTFDIDYNGYMVYTSKSFDNKTFSQWTAKWYPKDLHSSYQRLYGTDTETIIVPLDNGNVFVGVANYEGLNSVQVDISEHFRIGAYYIYNVSDFTTLISSGTYIGGNITIDVSGAGDYLPGSSENLGVYIITKSPL